MGEVLLLYFLFARMVPKDNGPQSDWFSWSSHASSMCQTAAQMPLGDRPVIRGHPDLPRQTQVVEVNPRFHLFSNGGSPSVEVVTLRLSSEGQKGLEEIRLPPCLLECVTDIGSDRLSSDCGRSCCSKCQCFELAPVHLVLDSSPGEKMKYLACPKSFVTRTARTFSMESVSHRGRRRSNVTPAKDAWQWLHEHSGDEIVEEYREMLHSSTSR